MPVTRVGGRPYDQPGEGTILVCPSCGNDEVACADVVLATALGEWVVEGNDVVFDPGGDTDIHWDSQQPRDSARPCFCGDCRWGGGPHQLVTAERFEELKAMALAHSWTWLWAAAAR
jgi:hypothetical protein